MTKNEKLLWGGLLVAVGAISYRNIRKAGSPGVVRYYGSKRNAIQSYTTFAVLFGGAGAFLVVSALGEEKAV